MPDFVDKAEMLFDLGRFDLAIAELIKALAEDPDDAWVHANLARCHLALGSPLKALAAARQAAELAPDQEFAHYWMAACQRLGGDLESASASIDEAVRLNPLGLASLTLAGRIAAERLQWFEASNLLDRALAVDPSFAEARNLKTYGLMQTGNHALAKWFNDETLRLHPEDGFALYVKGCDSWQHGDPDKASDCFEQALRWDPQCAPTRRAKIDLEKIKNPFLGRLLRLRQFKIADNIVLHYTFLFFMVFVFIWCFNIEKMTLKNNDIGVGLNALFIFLLLGPWTMDPLTDFFLNAKGRRFLTAEEVRQAYATAALVGIAFLGIPLMIFLSRDWWILGGYTYLFPFLFLLPILGILSEKRKYRKTLFVLMSIMAGWLLAGGCLVIGSVLIPFPDTPFEFKRIMEEPNRPEALRIFGFWCWNLIPLFALPCAYLVKKG